MEFATFGFEQSESEPEDDETAATVLDRRPVGILDPETFETGRNQDGMASEQKRQLDKWRLDRWRLVVNAGGHRIGFAFNTTNAARLQMDPPSGVLDPKEEINILISCDAFDAEAQGTNSDRVTVEWVNTPEGAAKTFRREWLQGDVMTRRKNLPIEYNL